MTLPTYITATADDGHAVDGVAVVASYQMGPTTNRPYKVRGVALDGAKRYGVEIALTASEARKLISDFERFGGLND